MKNTLRCEPWGQRVEMCACLPSQLSCWPYLFDGTPRFNSSGFLSDPDCVSFSPVPVLHIQLHPGPDLLLRVPEGELRVKNADHDGGPGGLQHHPAPHPRPRLGRVQPGPVSEVSRPARLVLITLVAIMVLWSYVQWKLIKSENQIKALGNSQWVSLKWWFRKVRCVFILDNRICVEKCM